MQLSPLDTRDLQLMCRLACSVNGRPGQTERFHDLVNRLTDAGGAEKTNVWNRRMPKATSRDRKRPPSLGHMPAPRSPRPLTPRQLEVLTAIRDHIRAHGVSPSQSDLARRFCVRTVSMHQLLCALRNNGHLTWSPWQRHSMRLTDVASKTLKEK